MSTDRYVVLGLARVGSPWFADVARWATAAALPLEFVKAQSAEEVRVRLSGPRPFSALLVDADAPGVDRDLLATARGAGCAVLVVGGPVGRAAAAPEGPEPVLAADFTRDQLHRALEQAARAVPHRTEGPALPPVATAPTGSGGLIVAVVGRGSGTSTVAMGLAQDLAGGRPGARRRAVGGADVCLVDGALRADQGLLHGAPDVVPGIVELAEAHRLGRPDPDVVRAHTWTFEGRAHRLLLGLRQPRDWTVLRPRSVDQVWDGLRHTFAFVVVDLDDDLDGEEETGSADLEDRNALSRRALATADLVLVVGRPDLVGLHHLLRLGRSAAARGVPPERILPVVNRSAGSRRHRHAVDLALARLGEPASAWATPIHLPEHRGIEAAVRDGRPLPAGWTDPLPRLVVGLLDRLGPRLGDRAEPWAPVAVGSLGAWATDSDDDGGGGDGR